MPTFGMQRQILCGSVQLQSVIGALNVAHIDTIAREREELAQLALVVVDFALQIKYN